MMDGNFSAMIQHHEEDKAQKNRMEKEQRSMLSTPTGKALVLVRSFLSLQQFFFSISFPRTLGVPSKVTTLANGWYVFLPESLTPSTKQYLESSGKCHCWRRVALHKLVRRWGWYAPIDWLTPQKGSTNRDRPQIFLASQPMISGLWDVFYTNVFFGSPLCNFDCQ